MRAWRGPRWVRVLLGVWLSLVLSDAGLIHACQSRSEADGTPAPAMAAVAVAAQASHEAHHGHHGAHDPAAPDGRGGARGEDVAGESAAKAAPQATAPGHDDHDGHDGHGTRDCSCLGHCCPPVPLAMAVSADIAFTRVVLATAVRPGRPAHAVRAAWADYVLPFGTAPPARVV
jgi:hypothetical protein